MNEENENLSIEDVLINDNIKKECEKLSNISNNIKSIIIIYEDKDGMIHSYDTGFNNKWELLGCLEEIKLSFINGDNLQDE